MSAARLGTAWGAGKGPARPWRVWDMAGEVLTIPKMPAGRLQPIYALNPISQLNRIRFENMLRTNEDSAPAVGVVRVTKSNTWPS